jgi:hypothetical protein
MAFSFSIVSNIPQITQSSTDTGLGGIATAITAVPTVARSTAYTTTQMVKPPTGTQFWFRCSTAGTTAVSAPTYTTITASGQTITDGTAVFTSFMAPEQRALGSGTHYYMPEIRMSITGALTNANPMYNYFTVLDLYITGVSAHFISGAWATDGVTPRWDGTHFICARNGSGPGIDYALGLNANSQMTLIGGEVQVSGSITWSDGTTPRSYKTKWRSAKDFGTTSTRIRAYSRTGIFRDIELFDIAYDMFNVPAEFSAVARGSEYILQYVGSPGGGVDVKVVLSNIQNVDGTYDFDNFNSGWVEIYNCPSGAALKVTTQNSTPARLLQYCVPLYQDLAITAKDTSGNVVPNVRFSATEAPTNSPTITITTIGNLKTWDFRNPITYQTTTNSSGIATSSPVLNVWYYESSLKQSLRFPSSTATYQGRAYNYKTMNASAVLGASEAIPVSAGMVGLDTPTTVTEAVASAITGVTLTPSGATGGVINVSSAKTVQEVWNYYRWWISQFANFGSNDTWTYISGNLNIGAWTITGIENLTGGTITTSSATANGAFSNLSIVGDVTQNTPTNLTGVNTTGTLTYNTNTNIAVTFTNCTIGTVTNLGTGIVTITGTNTTITNYTDAEINYLNSTATILLPTGFDGFGIYASNSDALAEINPIFTGTSPNTTIKYKAEQYGGQTIYIRPTSSTIVGEVVIMPQLVPVGIGNYTFNVVAFSEDYQLSIIINSLNTLNDNLPKVNRNVIKASKLIPAKETF